MPAEGLTVGSERRKRRPPLHPGLGAGLGSWLPALRSMLLPICTSTSGPWLSLLPYLERPVLNTQRPVLNTLLSTVNPFCSLLSLNFPGP